MDASVIVKAKASGRSPSVDNPDDVYLFDAGEEGILAWLRHKEDHNYWTPTVMWRRDHLPRRVDLSEVCPVGISINGVRCVVSPR